MKRLALVAGLCLFACPASAKPGVEALLLETPRPDRLRAWHERFCQEPHPAGTAADRRMVEILTNAFREIGVEVEQHGFHPYLPSFVSAQVEVLRGTERKALRLREAEVDGDVWVLDDGPVAWNAYSGSGDVTAPVVYANYGTKEDFEALEKLDVGLEGKIVIARYGKNYRGYKAKYAEAAGAAGLLMYTDPADSGYAKGAMYPEGGYANPTSIQRGSIKTLDYAGDPLTPGIPATEQAKRLDPAAVALPKIPVQPLGWQAAGEILRAMGGDPVPAGWQGGLPFVYRLGGGTSDLRVRLQVKQERSIKPCTNVVGRIDGFTHETVVIGCHYDAWTFGAGDPHAGTIVLYEMARSFAEAVKTGWKPRRTILFANWAAEEYGIIGSTEWVESQARDRQVVAYVNLDMAAMGTQFRSSADPYLQDVIEAVTERVPQAGDVAMRSVAHAWRKRGDGVAQFGLLGGGSDHVAFYCHAGIPSCTLGAGGSKGVSYHSSYDNLAWYRQVVGDDYEGARMVTRVANLLVERLAGDPAVPYAPGRLPAFLRAHLSDLDARARKASLRAPSTLLHPTIAAFENAARTFGTRLRSGRQRDARAGRDSYHDILRRVAATSLTAEPTGPRGWYRNLLSAPDPTSGYAAWPLPKIRAAIEAGDKPAFEAAVLALQGALSRAIRLMTK